MAGLRHHSKKIVKDAVELYQQGLSGPEISRKLGISSRSVGRWVRRCGISRPKGGSKSRYDSSNWENSKTAVHYGLRRTSVYRKWRLQVLERDSFQCWDCGQISGELHVHHILSFTEYPFMRTNIQNGITLCRKCHMVLHGKIKKEVA